MNNHDFMDNHIHSEDSNFRLKDCIVRAEDIVDRAIELGHMGVSITDHETVSAHIRILKRYQELKELQRKYQKYINDNEIEMLQKDKKVQKDIHLLEIMKEDFKLGLGNEIYLIDDLSDVRENYESGITKFWHFILIAKNGKGYEQLKKISSESAWKNWFRHGKMERVPTIKKEMENIIGSEKGNLIATSACLGGFLPNAIIRYFQNGDQQAKKDIHQFITWGIDLFGKENFFIEIHPTTEKQTDDIKDTHPQVVLNQNAFKLAKAYGIGVTIATDSHYLKKEHRMVHESYLKADDDNNSNRELGDFYSTTYMMSKQEICELISTHLTNEEIDMAFQGTMDIHKQIEGYELSHEVIVPSDKKIPIFNIKHLFYSYYEKYPHIKKFAYSDSIQDNYFLYLCELGFENKQQEFNDENLSRINQEMETIWLVSEKLNQRLSSYYVLVRGLIQEIMWRVSYVGVARGSVTGFYTCYLMGITQMNPIKYSLPFWRHLHQDRPELPD